MSASVTVDSSVWGDARFRLLARALNVDVYSAIGRMVAIWAACTGQETYHLDVDTISVHLECEPEDVESILCIKSRLGEATPDGIRIRGTEGRTEWLGKKRNAAKAGGRARADRAARNDAGEFVSADTRVQPPASQPPATSQPRTSHHPATRPAESSPTATATATATASSAAGAARGFDLLIAGYQEQCRGGEEQRIQDAAAKLGAHMRARREALRLSQRDVAAKVPDPALDARGIGNAERGKRDVGPGTWTAWHEALVKLEGVDEPGPNPDHARFMAEFGQLWRAHHGASGPTWQGANGGRLHKDLQAALAQHGLDEILRRARNMFASPLGYPLSTESDKDAATLLRHLDRFVTVRGQPRPTQQPQPAHGEQRALRSMDECKW